jgi:hypothetical protein
MELCGMELWDGTVWDGTVHGTVGTKQQDEFLSLHTAKPSPVHHTARRTANAPLHIYIG